MAAIKIKSPPSTLTWRILVMGWRNKIRENCFETSPVSALYGVPPAPPSIHLAWLGMAWPQLSCNNVFWCSFCWLVHSSLVLFRFSRKSSGKISEYLGTWLACRNNVYFFKMRFIWDLAGLLHHCLDYKKLKMFYSKHALVILLLISFADASFTSRSFSLFLFVFFIFFSSFYSCNYNNIICLWWPLAKSAF